MAGGQAGETRRMVGAGVGVFLLALAVRLLFMVDSADSPSYANPVVDAQTYHYIAWSLATGAGVGKGLFWQPIFYPLFLTALYKAFGVSILAAKIAQAVVGSASCVLVFLLGRRLFSNIVGILAGAIMAFYGPLIFAEGELLAEGWAVFWAAALLLLLVHARDRVSPPLYFAVGVASAFAILTRANFVPFVVVAVAGLALAVLRSRRDQPVARSLFFLAAAAFFVLLPPASLCRNVTGRFTVLPFGSGINCFIGNNPNWEETVAIRPGADWSELIGMAAEQGITDPWDASTFYHRLARHYMLNEPGAFLRGLVAKTERFICSREIPRNSEIYVQRQWSQILRFLVWKRHGFGFPFGVLFPLALVGLVVSWRRLPFPVWAFLVLYPATVILYFVSDRYRLPMIPLLAVLAAAGAVEIFSCATKGDRRGRLSHDCAENPVGQASPPVSLWGAFATLLALAVTVAVLTSIAPPYPEEQVNYEAELHWAVARSMLQFGDRGNVERELLAAVELQPDLTDAHNDLAVIYERSGRLADAVRQYELAAAGAPGNAGVRLNLGSAQLNSGQLEAAITNLQRAIVLDPLYTDAYVNLGAALARAGRHEEAIDQYHAAMATGAEGALVLKNLGHSYATLGRFREAAACYRQAMAYEPENSELRRRIEVMEKEGW